MISFSEAYKRVLEHPLVLNTEQVTLIKSMGRVLAEPIVADRDFPPYNRATKDGIALNYQNQDLARLRLKITGTASAGDPQHLLQDNKECLEIMTGAVLPKNCNTVVMYEHITIKNGYVVFNEEVVQGQNIHIQGSDAVSGAKLIAAGTTITPAEIGIMATVGKSMVLVKGLPKVCTIATGNELVEVCDVPKPHQIRKSNSITLQVALTAMGIAADSLHLQDKKADIQLGLEKALAQYDVLLLSGGVSKGKYDFIPDALMALGVTKVFHRVAQRPGKPFWFGIHQTLKTVVFSFPGNPVSTFANYHVYFLPWLKTSWQIPVQEAFIPLHEGLQNSSPLMCFIQVQKVAVAGVWYANAVKENGSGDMVSLAKADGFVCLPPSKTAYEKGVVVRFIPTR